MACELNGGAALLDLRSSIYYSLNPVGAEVWTALQSGAATIETLSQAVSQRFEVTPDACREDIAALLADFCKRDLARRTDAG